MLIQKHTRKREFYFHIATHKTKKLWDTSTEHIVCRKDMAPTTQATMQGDDARKDMAKEHQTLYLACNLVWQPIPYSVPRHT
jgi:hypothetical protein